MPDTPVLPRPANPLEGLKQAVDAHQQSVAGSIEAGLQLQAEREAAAAAAQEPAS